MKAHDISHIIMAGSAIMETGRGPYHLYPDTGEVYDNTGHYIGTGAWEGSKLIVTPIEAS